MDSTLKVYIILTAWVSAKLFACNSEFVHIRKCKHLLLNGGTFNTTEKKQYK